MYKNYEEIVETQHFILKVSPLNCTKIKYFEHMQRKHHLIQFVATFSFYFIKFIKFIRIGKFNKFNEIYDTLGYVF